jgi:hypothetical protein
MNMLYCILTHGSPRQTGRLLRAIYTRDDRFVIHIDQGAEPDYRIYVVMLAQALPNVHVISTRRCSWGGFSLIEATLDMLRLGLAADRGWDYAILLSATHLPVWPRSRFVQWLPKGRSVMLWADVPSAGDPGWASQFADRIELEYEEEPGVGMRPVRHLGRPPFIYCKGGQWNILTRAHVRYVLEEADPAIVDRLRRSAVADEAYFQTVLRNSPVFGECWWNRSTAVIWPPGAPRPATLGLREYAEAAPSARVPFIRKIAEDLADESEAASVIDSIQARPADPDFVRNWEAAERGRIATASVWSAPAARNA